MRAAWPRSIARGTPDGRFLGVLVGNNAPQLIPLGSRATTQEIRGLEDTDVALQSTSDGKSMFVAHALGGFAAEIYRIDLDTGHRQLIKTLTMHDPSGGYGITKVVTTPDGHYFAYNTLRQLSELYLLQGAH